MPIEEVFLYVLDEAPAVAVVAGLVWLFSRRDGRQRHTDERLAISIDSLPEKLDTVVEAIEHMDSRLDNHEVEIALLKQRGEGKG